VSAEEVTSVELAQQPDVVAENKLFATLDPASRRLRFPKEREVIITDTVGFIRELPRTLVSAFRATLEELEDASAPAGVQQGRLAGGRRGGDRGPCALAVPR
jgi:GTP-binding protein HflX